MLDHGVLAVGHDTSGACRRVLADRRHTPRHVCPQQRVFALTGVRVPPGRQLSGGGFLSGVEVLHVTS